MVILKKIKKMVKVYMFILIMIDIQDFGKMEKKMVKVYILEMKII